MSYASGSVLHSIFLRVVGRQHVARAVFYLHRRARFGLFVASVPRCLPRLVREQVVNYRWRSFAPSFNNACS
jgi:hypothetical protein